MQFEDGLGWIARMMYFVYIGHGRGKILSIYSRTSLNLNIRSPLSILPTSSLCPVRTKNNNKGVCGTTIPRENDIRKIGMVQTALSTE